MTDLTPPDSASADRRGQLIGLAVLSLSAFVAVTTELAPVGLLPTIGGAFHQGAASTGVLVSVYALMVVLFSVPLALLTRRISGKRMLLIALAGYAVSNVVCASAPTFAVLVAARCAGGVAHAIFFSACIGQAARLATPGRTARAFAVVSAGISAGFVLGSPLTTALGTAGGWRLPFAALVSLTLPTLVLLAWLLPSSAHARDTEQRRVGHTRRAAVRSGVGVIIANGLAYLGQYVLYTYVTLVLLHADVPRSDVAAALLVFGVAGLVTIWRTASLLDRRPRRTSVAVLLAVAASLVAVGIASSALIPVLVLGTLWGAAFGPVAALFQSGAVRTGAMGPETAGAWINTTSNVGIAAGALIGGIVLDHNGLESLAFLAAAPVAVSALVVAIAIPGRRSRFA